MNNFIYETPTKVYFGKDEEFKVGKITSKESSGTFRWKFSKKEWTA